MKQILRSMVVVVVAAVLAPLFCFAFTNNAIQPGATGSATPTAVGTATPVMALPCSLTLNGVANQTYSIVFQVTGGTVGTDGCYFMPASAASPCAAASPAPSAANKVGLFVPTGGAGFGGGTTINAPSIQQGILAMTTSAEWDAECTAGSMSVSRSTLP